MKQTRVGLVRRYVRRSMRLLPALVILLSLGLAGLAPADAAGTGVADAVAPSGEWKSLAAGLSGRLVFQTAYGGPLYTIDADGGNLQRLTNGIDPAWSPDGSQIAFVRWEDPRGVWVANADGSNARRVFDWSETRSPSWSPDGLEIVFARTAGGGGGGGGGGFPGRGGGRPGGGPPPGGSSGSGSTLGIVSTGDGSFREPQPVSTTNQTPDWSPDGAQIVLAGNNGLMVQNVDGDSWQLTTDPYDTTPAWSPDGTKVAFVRRQHDHWEIYVIDVTSGQQTRLTNTPALNGVATSSLSPAWSPDGAYIAFLTDRATGATAAGGWEIWVMKADGSAQAPLFGAELDGLALEYAFAGERALDWTW